MTTRAPRTRSTIRTYRGPAGAGAPNLADVSGVASVVSGESVVVELERFDSADLRLATSGITLAVHRTGQTSPAEAHWQLDLPDAIDGEQLRVPAPEPDVEGVDPEVPAELLELVRGVLRGARVVPVGRIRRVRDRDSLRDGRDREIATIVRDEVQLATLGRSTSVENWSEATVTAGPTLADVLAERLAALGAGPATGTAEAELEALLHRSAPPPPPRSTGSEGSAGAAVLDYLGRHADRLAAEDLRARRDEPDAVHQLRVSARRLRSALQAFSGLFTGPRPAALAEELRWLGRELAPARDLEVQEERITAALGELAPELVLGPVQAQVTRYFARRGAEARAGALAALDGERYTALRGALEHFLQDPPLAEEARRTDGLRAGLAKSTRRFDRRVATAIRAVEAGEPADAAVHAARKAGKRLRYATEVTGTKPRRLKRISRALGEYQDAVVGRVVLRELGVQAHLDGENGFTFGLLHGRADAEAKRIEAGLRELRRP